MHTIRKNKLLIIHSDESKRMHLEAGLSDYKFKIITSGDGKEGFALAKKEIPQLIIASAHLTGIDGFDLCWMIRQTPELNAVPYILLTDEINPEERINAYRSGADGYIEDNTSLREIYTIIETTIRRIQHIKRSTFSLQGNIVDFPVVDVLQMLFHAKKSGMLAIETGEKMGKIAFKDGNIVFAEQDQIIGEEAVKEMTGWKQGTFTLNPTMDYSAPNIQTSTMHLILTCCQILDEKID